VKLIALVAHGLGGLRCRAPRVGAALLHRGPARSPQCRWPTAGAYILACMAHQSARQGHPAEAVTLIETAVAGTRGRESASLTAELYSRQAYALASLGDASACSSAISKARTQAEQLTPDDDPPWLYWMSPANITADAGNCLLQLEQAERATGLLEEGVALFSKSLARDRQNYLIHLADALARPGKQCDLDAAASRGMVAIDLAEGLDSTRSINLIRNLHTQLKPHAKIPTVRDFVERAQGLALTHQKCARRCGR